jgi:hypothetical protein
MHCGPRSLLCWRLRAFRWQRSVSPSHAAALSSTDQASAAITVHSPPTPAVDARKATSRRSLPPFQAIPATMAKVTEKTRPTRKGVLISSTVFLLTVKEARSVAAGHRTLKRVGPAADFAFASAPRGAAHGSRLTAHGWRLTAGGWQPVAHRSPLTAHRSPLADRRSQITARDAPHGPRRTSCRVVASPHGRRHALRPPSSPPGSGCHSSPPVRRAGS